MLHGGRINATLGLGRSGKVLLRKFRWVKVILAFQLIRWWKWNQKLFNVKDPYLVSKGTPTFPVTVLTKRQFETWELKIVNWQVKAQVKWRELYETFLATKGGPLGQAFLLQTTLWALCMLQEDHWHLPNKHLGCKHHHRWSWVVRTSQTIYA